jgi:hypothetical protein
MVSLLYTSSQETSTTSFAQYTLRFFPHFQISSVPDWVLDSKLETHFLPGSKHETVHTYYEQEPLSQRPIKKSEHWQRESKIGGGGFGEVWLEICTERKNNGPHVRATKQMEVGRQVDYARELEAIAKFSHPKARLPATQRNGSH